MIRSTTKGYESVSYENPQFPVIVHYDSLGATLFLETHWHEEIEMLLMLEGQLRITSDRSVFTANPGDAVYIHPNSVHTLENITDSCQYYCALVKPNFLRTLIPALNVPEETLITKDAAVISSLERIIQEFYAKQPGYKTALQGELLAVTVYLNRAAAKDALAGQPINISVQTHAVQQAIAYIYQHFYEKITVEDICTAINFSKSYFSRSFRRITGKTIVDFINDLRLNYACHLIRLNKYTVSQCAEKSGFQNISYFTKLYQRHFGFLPSKTMQQAELPGNIPAAETSDRYDDRYDAAK